MERRLCFNSPHTVNLTLNILPPPTRFQPLEFFVPMTSSGWKKQSIPFSHFAPRRKNATKYRMASDIAKKAADSAEHAEQRALALMTRVKELEDSNASLGHIVRALCEFISTKTGVTPEELRARVFEIRSELRRKHTEPPVSLPCPACARPVAKGRDTCMYCGAKHDREDIFDNVLT